MGIGSLALYPASAFSVPPQSANCSLALMSYDRQDTGTATGLMDLSVWADDNLQNPAKPFFPGKLTASAEAGLLKALIAVDGHQDRWVKWPSLTVVNARI